MTDHVEAEVNAVATVDIVVSCWTEHRLIAGSLTCERVGGGIEKTEVGFNFDNGDDHLIALKFPSQKFWSDHFRGASKEIDGPLTT